jgi:hypothetical protein
MTNDYGNGFLNLIPTLRRNPRLKEIMTSLVKTSVIISKATEEKEREEIFRSILLDFIDGKFNSFEEIYCEVENRLPRTSSKYADNSRVFSSDWAKRHVNTQLNRFYNEAIIADISLR